MKRWMKVLLLCCCLTGCLVAAEKLPAGWTDNYPAAVKRAEKEKKALLLLFTGSDWCGWCIKLKKEVLGTAEFRKLSAKVVPVYLDFPRRKKLSKKTADQNKELSRQFRVGGFPTTVVVTPEGKELTRIGGYCPAEEYVKRVETAL